MDTDQDRADCAKRCRFVAILSGAIVAVLLVAFGGWGFFAALVIGLIVAAAVAWFFFNKVCVSGASQSSAPVSAPPSPAPSKAAAPVEENVASQHPDDSEQPTATATPATESMVKPSTPLPGQAELAARKGTWKYQAEGAAAPAKAKKPAAKKAESSAAEGSGTKPATLASARDGGADNLKQIKGVGPKLEALLHTMGYYHFDQIATWGPQEVTWVDQNLVGFKGRVSRDDWVGQAKILAEGGSTEFSSKVKKGDVY